MRVFKIFLLLFVAGVHSSCGYRFSTLNNPLLCKTISVPYVIGDRDGYLTAEIVHELIASGYHYQRCGGNLILRVEVLEIGEEDIGFRFERNEQKMILHSIISSETRLRALVQFDLLDPIRCCIVSGPFTIPVEVEFDHEYYSSPNDINERSLGQLTDFDSAREAALRPLSRRIARRIVEFLNNNN